MDYRTNVRSWAYLLSQYLWFVVVLGVVSLVSPSTASVPMPARRCSANKSFSEGYQPDYFYHLTDIHISHAELESVDRLKQALKVGSFYSPQLLLITGDMVDGYHFPYKSHLVRVAQQKPEDWKLYRKAFEEVASNFSHVYECAGNHDVSRVWSLNSEKFCYANYSFLSREYELTKSLDNFQMIIKTVGNFTHILINPLTFPLAPIPFNYFPQPSKSFLDRLEREIDGADPTKTLVLSSHYHGPVWSDQRSSRGHSFVEILNNPKVSIFVSGHNHGKEEMIMHHGDALEICGSDLRYNKKAGIVTVDNSMTIFHYIDINSPPDFFVTYPAPLEQTTSRTVCDVGKPLIRLIAFSDDAEFYATIDSGLPQKLTLIREIKTGVYLYSANLKNVGKGKHTMEVKGLNSTRVFQFFYDTDGTVPEGKETIYDDMLWAKHHVYVYGFLYAIALFITFPVNFLLFDKFNDWISDSDVAANPYIMWVSSVFAGFIGMRSRIAKLPWVIRIMLFASTLVSIFVPFFSFDVEGHLQHALSIGVVLDGKLKYERWCPFDVFYFFCLSVMPTLFAISSIGLATNFNWVRIVDIFIFCGLMFYCYYISFVTYSLINGQYHALLSGFVVYITVWFLIDLVYIIYECIKRNRDFTYLDARLDALVDSSSAK